MLRPSDTPLIHRDDVCHFLTTTVLGYFFRSSLNTSSLTPILIFVSRIGANSRGGQVFGISAMYFVIINYSLLLFFQHIVTMFAVANGMRY